MTAKPALGYPTRTEAVHALRKQGLTTREIAGRFGISTSAVTALELGGGGCRAVRPSERLGRTVVLSIDVLDALRPAAERRKITVAELVRRIVATVADEGMVDAVMDDG